MKFKKSVGNLKAAMKISKNQIKFKKEYFNEQGEMMGYAEERDFSMTTTSAILPS